MRILFVCTGNLCRSPMAEGLLRHCLEERGCRDVAVASAGTWAGTGHSATPEAVATLREGGVDIGRHRSRPLDPDEVAAADLVIAMTSVHMREVLHVAPEADSKLLLMKTLAELDVEELPLEAPRQRRLHALLAAARPEWRRVYDLDDPIGLPLSAYERAAREIRTAVDALVDVLCGPENGEVSEASI